MRVAVVVLGELARSRRTLRHARELGALGHEVELVGYLDMPLPGWIAGNPAIHVHAVRAGRSARGAGGAAVLGMALRGARLALALARILLARIPKPDAILVQSPPALPSVAVCVLAGRLRGCPVVVDWHNLGWTLHALRFGADHPFVRLAEGLEVALARGADGHLAVSRCLAAEVERRVGSGPGVVLDRATPDFTEAGALARTGHRTRGTGDPAVVVCPMGWTRDDDVALLVEALRIHAVAARPVPAAPPGPSGEEPPRRPLRVVLSGTGPLLDAWAPRIAALDLPGVEVETVFVPADAYPALLASADAGVSVHRSSSGLDLPMKIFEMRAVGLPVLALDYGPCLAEALPLRDGEDTLLFTSPAELARGLDAVVSGALAAPARHGADAGAGHPGGGVDTGWADTVLPLLRRRR